MRLPNIEECCGFGGTFSVKMPGTSLAMGKTKTENIVKSGADVVVSPDVSCLMHIGGIPPPQTRNAAHSGHDIAEVLVAGNICPKPTSIQRVSEGPDSRALPSWLASGSYRGG
jgi:hypothetical protein